MKIKYYPDKQTIRPQVRLFKGINAYIDNADVEMYYVIDLIKEEVIFAGNHRWKAWLFMVWYAWKIWLRGERVEDYENPTGQGIASLDLEMSRGSEAGEREPSVASEQEEK